MKRNLFKKMAIEFQITKVWISGFLKTGNPSANVTRVRGNKTRFLVSRDGMLYKSDCQEQEPLQGEHMHSLLEPRNRKLKPVLSMYLGVYRTFPADPDTITHAWFKDHTAQFSSAEF